MTLNYLLYANKSFCPMEAVHNYNCHIGRAKRRNDGRVVIDYPPCRMIGVVHLTYSSKMMSRYIDAGLLFNSGSYLEPRELDGLRRLNHY